MTASAIEWTGRSDWNPVRGCTRASQGCGTGTQGGCYAEQIAGRFSDPGQPFHGFATRTPKGGRWTGKVALMEDRLTLPLRWRKPATVFVNSTSDIFHESLPDEAIDRIFAVMALAPQHTFQVLTKRAERMRHYFAELTEVSNSGGSEPYPRWAGHVEQWANLIALKHDLGVPWRHTPLGHGRLYGFHADMPRPLPNVHLGVSVEDQAAADERVPHLLATPAPLRFLSCEPLIGPVDLTAINHSERSGWLRPLTGDHQLQPVHADHRGARIHWVIAGGESGRGARPMHPDWARSLRDQCAAAEVPFFFKQWGEWAPREAIGQLSTEHGATWRDLYWMTEKINPSALKEAIVDAPDVWRIGKRRAGRLLDGRTHNAVPG